MTDAVDKLTVAELKRAAGLHGRMGSSSKDESDTAQTELKEFLAKRGLTWNDLAEIIQRHSRVMAAEEARKAAGGAASGSASTVRPEDVDKALDLACSILQDYLALDQYDYIAVALWSAHTHVYARFMHTPRLMLTSPTRGCGKTTVLEVLEFLTWRPRRTGSITPATIYRWSIRNIRRFCSTRPTIWACIAMTTSRPS